ncbi:MAG TPA: hypothetical protein DCE41_22515 [Cytophagales bacterium]|nr:hypothetical protein [Cytophagales bacterium]
MVENWSFDLFTLLCVGESGFGNSPLAVAFVKSASSLVVSCARDGTVCLSSPGGMQGELGADKMARLEGALKPKGSWQPGSE